MLIFSHLTCRNNYSFKIQEYQRTLVNQLKIPRQAEHFYFADGFPGHRV
jgi:hypothetical protein